MTMDNIDFTTLLKDLKFHKSCISQKNWHQFFRVRTVSQSIALDTFDFLSSHIQNLVGFYFGGVGRIELVKNFHIENNYRQINILLGPIQIDFHLQKERIFHSLTTKTETIGVPRLTRPKFPAVYLCRQPLKGGMLPNCEISYS